MFALLFGTVLITVAGLAVTTLLILTMLGIMDLRPTLVHSANAPSPSESDSVSDAQPNSFLVGAPDSYELESYIWTASTDATINDDFVGVYSKVADLSSIPEFNDVSFVGARLLAYSNENDKHLLLYQLGDNFTYYLTHVSNSQLTNVLNTTSYPTEVDLRQYTGKWGVGTVTKANLGFVA
jgi:hypothetical protein